MAQEPTLVLSHQCEYNGKLALYTISFFSNCLTIKNSKGNETKISYSDVYKIKSNSKKLRIIFKDNEEISVPCTLSEIKKIKKLFKKSSEYIDKEIDGVAYIEFGELGFFIRIYSNNFNEFKTAIIKRIARYFYPALDQDHISLEIFDKFILKLKKGAISAVIQNTSDLDAVLRYFDNKIDIVIEKDVEG